MIRRIRGNAFRYRIIPFLVSVDDLTEKSEREELHPHDQGEPPDDEKRAHMQCAGADPFIAEIREHSPAEKDAREPDEVLPPVRAGPGEKACERGHKWVESLRCACAGSILQGSYAPTPHGEAPCCRILSGAPSRRS